jgi:hypothetical protein
MSSNHPNFISGCLSLCLLAGGAVWPAVAADDAVAQLGHELAGLGWIVYSARTAQGDYDLFLARPDGSRIRNLTGTPQFNEFGGRFSPDGARMLYRRTARGEALNHDLWGALGAPVVANADGSKPEVLGAEGDLPWACWSPDGQQVSCLHKKLGKIRIVDLRTRRVVRELPRQGIFQQMFWSPDGARLCGTANLSGQDWNIISVDLETGRPTLLTRNLNCTPDWFQKDPLRVIYSHRTPGVATDYGWTMLMQATADGQQRSLVYAERGKHIYYGCTSPDDQYVIFSVPETDGGTDAILAVIRMADAPVIVPEDYRELRALYPKARSGPVFRWKTAGFEPHWTDHEIAAAR